MNLQEQDFCWVSRHALMDLVMLEVYKVKDKIGVTEFIENMNDHEIYDLTTSMVRLDESIHTDLLNHLYIHNLKELRNDLPIYNMSNIYEQRDLYLSEAEDNKSSETSDNDKKMTAGTIIGIGMTVSLTAAVNEYVKWLFRKPKEALKARKDIARALGKKFDTAVNNIPILKKIIYPEEYAKKFGDELTAKIKKIKKMPPAEKTKLIKAAKQKIKDEVTKAGRSPTVRIRKTVEKIVKKITEDPAEVAKKQIQQKLAQELAGKQPSHVHGKIAVSLLGIVALTSLTYTIYKYVTDKARVSCKDQSGKAKTGCILKFKIAAATAAIKKLEEGLTGCDNKPDPNKCRYSIQKQIWYWNRRKQKYQEQMSKLAQK